MAESENIELTRMKYEFDAAARKERYQFVFNVLTMLIQLVTPVMLYYTHQDTVSKVDSTKAIVEQRAQEIDQKATASLLQWKAYTTKEPEDMAKAAASLQKADANP